MKKFTIIREDLATKVKISDDFEEVQNELIDILKKSTNSGDSSLQLKTMKSYIGDSETTIIGLVNDSDVYDFYLKNMNDIDSVLSDIVHFTSSPEEIGSTNSLYDYIVMSTKIAIQDLFKKMTSDSE